VREGVAAGVGDDEDLGGSAATATRRGARLALGEDAVGQQLLEVTSHGGGREAQPLGEVGCGRRTVLQDRRRHALARGGVVDGGRLHLLGAHVFHNTSVPLLIPVVQRRQPSPTPPPAAHGPAPPPRRA
jgi:hypothetical protein